MYTLWGIKLKSKRHTILLVCLTFYAIIRTIRSYH